MSLVDLFVTKTEKSPAETTQTEPKKKDEEKPVVFTTDSPKSFILLIDARDSLKEIISDETLRLKSAVAMLKKTHGISISQILKEIEEHVKTETENLKTMVISIEKDFGGD